MIRKLLKDSAVYTIATVLTKGIQLFLLPVLTRLLSPSEYGVNDIVTIFSLYLVSFLTMELQQAIARFYPAEKDLGRKALISSTGLFFILGTYSLFLVIALPVSGTIAKALLRSDGYAPLLRLALVAMAINGVFSYLQAQLRWDLRSFDYSLSSITFVIVSTTVSIVSIAMFKFGGAGVFVGQIAGSTCAGVLSFFRNRSIYRLAFSKSQLGAMLRFSSPLFVSTWLALTSLYIDRFFIQANLSMDSVGIYGIASKFSSVVSILFVGFNMAFTPLIYANADSETLPSEIAKTFSIFLPLAGLLSSFTFVFSREIIFVLTSSAYHSGRRVMPVLVLSSILANLYLFTPGLSIRKNTKPLVFISFVSMALSVSLNALLVPALGMGGSALASVTTSGCVFLLNYWFSQRCYYIPFKFKSIVAIGCVVIISGVVGYVLDNIGWPFAASVAAKTAAMVAIVAFVLARFPQVVAAAASALRSFRQRVDSAG